MKTYDYIFVCQRNETKWWRDDIERLLEIY